MVCEYLLKNAIVARRKENTLVTQYEVKDLELPRPGFKSGSTVSSP